MCLRSIVCSDGMPGYVWDYYATSVTMSSYLVAFLVSEFEAVPTTTTHRVPFRLWVKPQSTHLAEYVSPNSINKTLIKIFT